MWFVEALARRGHHVRACFTREGPGSYEGIRGRRVRRLSDVCDCRFGMQFGDDAFLELLSGPDSCDVLCHHAAEVTGYKRADFDVAAAVASNTRRVRDIVAKLEAGGGRLLCTGSVFEGGEGLGTANSEGHFSPYGLSKAISWQICRYFANAARLPIAKFVISNPFGPFDEPRFCEFLMNTWTRGEIPVVRTPDYVRDNIHVSLLAEAYAEFAERFATDFDRSPGENRGFCLHPSGYVESQGVFAQRFAREMDARLPLRCECTLAQQVAFDEPRIRFNTDPAARWVTAWDESAAWDTLADYYRERPI